MTRAEQQEDGRDEAQRQVREALLHIKYQEMGLSWKDARDRAREDTLQFDRAERIQLETKRHQYARTH